MQGGSLKLAPTPLPRSAKGRERASEEEPFEGESRARRCDSDELVVSSFGQGGVGDCNRLSLMSWLSELRWNTLALVYKLRCRPANQHCDQPTSGAARDVESGNLLSGQE